MRQERPGLGRGPSNGHAAGTAEDGSWPWVWNGAAAGTWSTPPSPGQPPARVSLPPSLVPWGQLARGTVAAMGPPCTQEGTAQPAGLGAGLWPQRCPHPRRLPAVMNDRAAMNPVSQAGGVTLDVLDAGRPATGGAVTAPALPRQSMSSVGGPQLRPGQIETDAHMEPTR